MLSTYVYVPALVIVVISHWIYKWKNPKCSGRLPPGSLGLPFIGETIQFVLPSKSIDIPHFVKSRIHKYGHLFKTSLAGRPVVVSADPDFNHFILQQEGKLVELWYLDSFAELLGQKGLNEGSTTAIGHVHKYLRNLVLSHFGPESLKENLLQKLEDMATKNLDAWSRTEFLDIKKASDTMIINATAKEIFGYDPEKCKESLSENLTDFLQGLMSFPLNIPGTAFHRCLQKQKKVRNMIKSEIEERRRALPEQRRGDLLDQIVEDMKGEKFLTDEFVSYIVFGLLLASFEGMASALTLAVKSLSEHPQALRQLEIENEEVLQSRNSNERKGLIWKEYKSMTFTHQVVSETLRMASLAPGILRRVIKDVQVNGYIIPAGWTIMVVPAALQLNPNTYKDPLAFNPWRWEGFGGNFTAKNYIPFGGGSRSCAGAEYTKTLMGVFLHVLVTKYRWIKVKGGEVVRAPVLGFGKGYFVKLMEKSPS